MNFTCDRKELEEAISMVARAVRANTNTSILECVLLTAVEDGFYLIGTDKDIYIKTKTVSAVVMEEGSIALDAKLFAGVIQKLTDSAVVIETDDRLNAVCKSGRAKLKISGLGADEFPIIDISQIQEGSQSYAMPAKKLRDMIKKTIFSVSRDISKPVLGGEKFNIKDGKLEVISLDMFRISYSSHMLGDVSEASVIVPAKTLNDLANILPDNEDISFYFNQNKAVFSAEDFTLVTTLIAGEYVRYDQIYNDDYATVVVAERLPLLYAVERAILLSVDARPIPLQIMISDDDITLKAESERGNVNDGIPCETEGKDELTIYLNSQYLRDALNAIDEDTVVMRFNSVHSPCVVKGKDSENDYRYLIVPLRSPQ